VCECEGGGRVKSFFLSTLISAKRSFQIPDIQTYSVITYSVRETDQCKVAMHVCGLVNNAVFKIKRQQKERSLKLQELV
jgi:hypothetical protein